MINYITFNKVKKNGIMFDPKSNIITKFALEKKNFYLIQNEFRGYHWYFKNIKRKKFFSELNKKNQENLKFSIPLINGKKINFWENISNNYTYIQKILNFYNKIWPNKIYTGAHGDLTFSNIIFKKNDKIEFIDWENFHNKEVWGYDICYFLISTISLPLLKNKQKKFSNKDLDLFEKLWKSFFKKKHVFSIDPIQFMKSKYKKFFKYRGYKEFFPNQLNYYLSNQISEITNK